MPRVVVTAEVEDGAKWEESFRTHANLFRKQTISNPITFSILEGNQVACCFEPENLDTCLQILDSSETPAQGVTGEISPLEARNAVPTFF